MDGVRIGEDVVGGLPIGVLVGSAKARDSERRRISKRSTEVGGRGPVPRRSCERIDNRGRVVAEEALGKRHVIRPSADIVAHCEQVRQLPTSLLAKSDQVDGLAPGGSFLCTLGCRHLANDAR